MELSVTFTLKALLDFLVSLFSSKVRKKKLKPQMLFLGLETLFLGLEPPVIS